MILYRKLWNFDLLWKKLWYYGKNYGTILNYSNLLWKNYGTMEKTMVLWKKNYGTLIN